MDMHLDAALAWMAPSRRLKTPVRELSAKVVIAREEEFGLAISDLKSALREPHERLRKLTLAKMTGMLPAIRKRSF
jgi:hypothetical protein